MVLAEFLDLVDDNFGEETTDEILKGCPLESGGTDGRRGPAIDPQWGAGNPLQLSCCALPHGTEVFGQCKGELERLAGVETRIAMGVIPR